MTGAPNIRQTVGCGGLPSPFLSAPNVMSTRSESIRGRGSRASLPLLGILVLSAAPACTTQTVERPVPTSEMAGMAPSLSVERFLQAVNARDYASMAGLFGTVEGPIEGDRAELEVRMDLMAQVLRHDDYRIVSQSTVPGRATSTTRIGVDLTVGQRIVPDVEFLVVRSTGDRWLIEQVDLEAVTGG